jgi:hypothetical protein
MKKYIYSAAIIALLAIQNLQAADSLIIKLDRLIFEKGQFDFQKENKIEKIKNQLGTTNLLPVQIYEINRTLYNEYYKYQSDSALNYILQNRQIAKQLQNLDFEQEVEIQLANIYAMRVMYIETEKILNDLSKMPLSQNRLMAYYTVCEDFCSNYGQATGDNSYYTRSEHYRDLLLAELDTSSLAFKIENAAKKLYSNQPVEQDLLALLADTDNTHRGIIGYFLGYYYEKQGDLELAKHYFALSAISDIENSVKDNASQRALSMIFFKEGNIKKAHQYMQAAIDDVLFCNLKFRTIEISSLYPVINAALQEKEQKQKQMLSIYLIVASFFVLILAIACIYIWRQLKRIAVIRKELYRTNVQLSSLNNQLLTTNNLLNESNHIKEEYIAQFFDICSDYINKLDNYRKSAHKLMQNRQNDELLKILRSTTMVDTELEELYKKFDTIFLNLYPLFVEKFNNLQNEKITLKSGELLNTELRIFALIRLGITDSVKIASFLRYSISTIYNYRVKARNNATVSRDSFEDDVMKIY